jgi:glucose/arabinose dehydrogenase
MNRATAIGISLLMLLSCQKGAQADQEGVYVIHGKPTSSIPAGKGLKLTQVASGLKRPVGVVSPPNDPRLFIVEQGGTVRVLKDGQLLKDPFLDISKRTSKLFSYSEQGLLDLAFHPDYAKNGRFFVHYTAREDGRTVLAEMLVQKKNPNRAQSTEQRLFEAAQPFGNHNGGELTFGPDGMLYLGLGDGGSAGDPKGHGQNLGTPLGAILRFQVDKPGIAQPAPGNPFAKKPGARPEIFAYGLRNPWRFSFDSVSGDLIVADVGQNTWEWISRIPKGTSGQNFGWNITEGFSCFQDEGCRKTGIAAPLMAYDHTAGCSITGGFVYWGRKIPQIQGHYFYSDYCTPWVHSFQLKEGRIAKHQDWSSAFSSGRLKAVSAFGVDSQGELYVVDYRRGNVWRIDPAGEK